MKRFANWIIILGIVAGLLWWQRTLVVPYVVGLAPATAPLIARVPALAPLTKPGYRPPTGEESAAAGSRRGGGGPVAVVVAAAEMKDLPMTIDAVGAANASASLVIRPRVDSQVVTVDVAEGSRVKQGDRLFTLDDRTIKAELAQLEATITKDKAQIEQARSDLARANDLLTRNAGNVVTRDTAATAVKVAEAQLASDEASRDVMATTLSYTIINAPVSGRIGSIPAKPGSIVRTSDLLPLAIVNQLDPSLVSFAIPQKRLGELRAAMAKGPVKVEVTVGSHVLPGVVDFVENTIDAATGTVIVKAKVDNPDEHLWPGAYVTVVVVLGGGEPLVAVPGAAIQLGQSGPYVFVVKDGTSAELRQVTVARTAGDDAVISQGLSAGEKVVVDGQLRLVDGAKVSIKEATAAEETAAVRKPGS